MIMFAPCQGSIVLPPVEDTNCNAHFHTTHSLCVNSCVTFLTSYIIFMGVDTIAFMSVADHEMEPCTALASSSRAHSDAGGEVYHTDCGCHSSVIITQDRSRRRSI